MLAEVIALALPSLAPSVSPTISYLRQMHRRYTSSTDRVVHTHSSSDTTTTRKQSRYQPLLRSCLVTTHPTARWDSYQVRECCRLSTVHLPGVHAHASVQRDWSGGRRRQDELAPRHRTTERLGHVRKTFPTVAQPMTEHDGGTVLAIIGVDRYQATRAVSFDPSGCTKR